MAQVPKHPIYPRVRAGPARHRGTSEGAGILIGRLLLLIASGKETSASLAEKLSVSPRQVNRYVVQLQEAGWQIERAGVPTHGDYWFELRMPQVDQGTRKDRPKRRRQGS